MSIVNNADIKRLFKLDKLFESISDKYGTPPNWSRIPGFISLSKIILEQQVSLASADAHFFKLLTYIKVFTPGNILKLTDEEMRLCQISRQKAMYLRGLSNAVLDGTFDFERLSKLDESAARIMLTYIKGIGSWTADIYMMFCMQSKNIFPIGDIALVNTVKELKGAETREEILDIAEKWQPLRSLATYYLWHNYLKKRNRPSELSVIP
jgi:DNA-3-methyladenine glycosylase II